MNVQNERIAVNVADRATLLDLVRERLRGGVGFAVATLNLDHVVKLQRSLEFVQAYRRHDFIVADGNPIVWLSRLAGRPVSLVPGSDLVEPLAVVAAQEQVPIALVGATDEALAGAAAVLTAGRPDLQIAARLAPGRNFDPQGSEATAMIESLRCSGARLAFLALGAPKQEIFAARCRAALPEMGFVSIGAGVDFLAGKQRRAPPWVRRLSMEWAWRMLLQPRRLCGRYARCFLILPSLTFEAFAGMNAMASGE
jgi:exopolysaccharide biosynthesis WecB/TagA/CpsF family protein